MLFSLHLPQNPPTGGLNSFKAHQSPKAVTSQLTARLSGWRRSLILFCDGCVLVCRLCHPPTALSLCSQCSQMRTVPGNHRVLSPAGSRRARTKASGGKQIWEKHIYCSLQDVWASPHLKHLVAWIERVFTFPGTSVATLNLCLHPKHAFDWWREEKLICWFWETAEPVQFLANIRTPEPGVAHRSIPILIPSLRCFPSCQADCAHSQVKIWQAVLNGNNILKQK